MHWNWTSIVRDTLIVFALTFIGSLIAALVGPQDPQAKLYMLAGTNLLSTALGFAVSGSLTPHHRFSHLWKVALLLWLVSLMNIFLVGASLQQWVLSAVLIVTAMGIGGAASYLVAAPRRSSYA
jgi:hypothetical protein